MKCINCSEEVPEGGGSLAMKVFLCGSCGESARLLADKASSGIENAVSRLEEMVREIYADPRYPIKSSSVQKLSAEEALMFLMVTDRDRKRRSWNKRDQSSGKGTKLPAQVAAGERSSSKPSAAD